MSRPAPERPGDALPTPEDFAGWPPLGALSRTIGHGPLAIHLDRVDAWAAGALGELQAPAEGASPEPHVRLQFTRAERGPWLPARPGDRARTHAWTEGGGLWWATHDAALLMDSRAERGIVVLTRQDEAATARSVQNVVRVASAWRLVLEGWGLLLHAAAVATGSGAVLFLGESGAGKSTAARLSAPRPVLADDACIVRCGEGSAPDVVPGYGFAEPGFPGRLVRGEALSVACVLRLRQAESHAVTALSTAAGAAALVAHAPFLLGHMGPRAAEIAGRIAGATGVAELRFAKDAGFWTRIDHHLADARRRRNGT